MMDSYGDLKEKDQDVSLRKFGLSFSPTEYSLELSLMRRHLCDCAHEKKQKERKRNKEERKKEGMMYTLLLP